MKMKRFTFFILMLAATVHTVFGQREAKAQAILDKTAAAYQKAGGIAITFGGTQQGTLLLKESCFYLDCAGIKSWFDGKTQWSYAQQNDEVTLSTPSPEEIQSVNPYALITSYKTKFNYRYIGSKTVTESKDRKFFSLHVRLEISNRLLSQFRQRTNLCISASVSPMEKLRSLILPHIKQTVI